jgi:hypothetical protein
VWLIVHCGSQDMFQYGEFWQCGSQDMFQCGELCTVVAGICFSVHLGRQDMIQCGELCSVAAGICFSVVNCALW